MTPQAVNDHESMFDSIRKMFRHPDQADHKVNHKTSASSAHSAGGIPSNIMAAFAAERSKIQDHRSSHPALKTKTQQGVVEDKQRTSEVQKLKAEVGMLKRKVALLEGVGEERHLGEQRPGGGKNRPEEMGPRGRRASSRSFTERQKLGASGLERISAAEYQQGIRNEGGWDWGKLSLAARERLDGIRGASDRSARLTKQENAVVAADGAAEGGENRWRSAQIRERSQGEGEEAQGEGNAFACLPPHCHCLPSSGATSPSPVVSRTLCFPSFSSGMRPPV